MDTKQYDPKTMSWDDIRDVVAATTLQMKETDRQIKETDRQMKETKQRLDEFIRENQRLREEADRRMAETDRKFRELANQFTSTTGQITESIMEPASIRIFKEAGFDIDRYSRNYKKKDRNGQVVVEVDLLMLNSILAIAVEIKTKCRIDDVDYFLRQMPKVRNSFTELRGKKLFAAIAAITYDKEAKLHAKEQGLLVISSADGKLFTLEPPEKEKLKTF